jgi:hypothetical protein
MGLLYLLQIQVLPWSILHYKMERQVWPKGVPRGRTRSRDPVGRNSGPQPSAVHPQMAYPAAEAFAGGASAPPPRRRKTAKERREQAQRADARRFLWACRSLSLARAHRGGELGRFGSALHVALQLSQWPGVPNRPQPPHADLTTTQPEDLPEFAPKRDPEEQSLGVHPQPFWHSVPPVPTEALRRENPHVEDATAVQEPFSTFLVTVGTQTELLAEPGQSPQGGRCKADVQLPFVPVPTSNLAKACDEVQTVAQLPSFPLPMEPVEEPILGTSTINRFTNKHKKINQEGCMVDPFVPTTKDLMVADESNLITQPVPLDNASPLGVLAPRVFCRLGEYFSAFGTHLEDDPLDEEIAFFRRVLSNWLTYAVLKRPNRERRLPRPSRPRAPEPPAGSAPPPLRTSSSSSSALPPSLPTPHPPAHGGRPALLRPKKKKNIGGWEAARPRLGARPGQST